MADLPCRTWRLLAVVVSALALLLVVACSRHDAAPATASEPASSPAPAPPDGTARASHPRTGRQLVSTAELDLEVASYEEARRVVDRELLKVGGRLANAKVNHTAGGVSNAELELRIPAERLAAFMKTCATLGVVGHENVGTEDITETYQDATARLANARRVEARYLEFLATGTGGVADVLEVERELDRIRERIERTEAQVRGFDAQVAMSRLTLHLTTRDHFSAGPPVSLAEDVSRTFSVSIATLVMAGRALVLVLVALLPWLVAMSGVWLLLYTLLRRRPRRSASPEQLRPG